MGTEGVLLRLAPPEVPSSARLSWLIIRKEGTVLRVGPWGPLTIMSLFTAPVCKGRKGRQRSQVDEDPNVSTVADKTL